MKTITLAQLIDSMEKNGFEQAYGTLMRPKEGADYVKKKSDVASACALGQGMLNLNIKSLSHSSKGKFDWPDFVKYVANLNDKEKWTPDMIARDIRKKYKDSLDTPLDAYSFREPTPFHSSMR